MLHASRLTDRVPAVVLAAVTAAERRGSSRLERWYRYAIDFFYWSGVRQAQREQQAVARQGVVSAESAGLPKAGGA
jgi:hypothetical protein